MFQSSVYEYLKKFFEQKNREENYIFICNDDKEALSAKTIAKLAGFEPFVLPDIRISYGEDLRPYQDELREFLVEISKYYASNDNKLLISPSNTLSLPIPKEKYFSHIEISFGDKIDNTIKSMLHDWGFSFVDIVADKGEVSFRGDIIDIYPINSEVPYRISLFGDDVESIRIFDIVSQKSQKDEIESFVAQPSFLALVSNEIDDIKQRINNSTHDVFIKDMDSLAWWELGEIADKVNDIFKVVAISRVDETIISPSVRVDEAKEYKDLVVTDINKIIETHRGKKRIRVVAKNESIVRGAMLSSFDGIEFVYIDGVVNIIGSDEIILSINSPIKAKKVKKSKLILDDLKPRDYVVHENYGVGFFRGIEKREVLGATREFVVIVYQNDDLLLVPVENLETIDRYMSEGGALPALDRLGKSNFRNLKAKVRDKLFAIAGEIIEMSAKRMMLKGKIIGVDQAVQDEFMSNAGFIHTEDQEEAIKAMLHEMKSGRMMDRLLSADVGFGKTEVALNGIFAAVKSGYQAAMIAPTTLLSSQHFKSLKERLGKYDIKVAKLDRFCTTKEKNFTLAGLAGGTIDVVIGTHALLGAKFANLAFVIIDEEHKFGVKQKEALKAMASEMHLLSMSATPIPRSLNMALSSVKSFSEILTPPMERQGVRTFVKSHDDKLLKEVILRELKRGGQVFFVHNSIATIQDKKRELQAILPSLRIAVLHSQISAKETEDEMIKFENGEYDLLLSTSIVESGIHMPHANTMIVNGADNFGMADLHQLRGRVGRGNKEGYCYFIVADKMELSELAKKRLIALESHSDLGSGAVLAMHDLEIRGGGNIIGEAQSGHIKHIGYGLYLRMLEDAIRELSGNEKEIRKSVEVKLVIDAFLNEELISEDRLRLELYRRLTWCESVGDVYEIASEIEDRFGKLDIMTKQFIDVMAIKILAKDKGVSKVSSFGENVFMEFEDETKERLILKSRSKDSDDILATAFEYLRSV